MARFDRNQFLLLATAIGAATTAAAATKKYDAAPQIPGNIATPDAVLADDESEPEPDQNATCDGDTGQTGRAKYCPISESRSKGCLDWSMCSDTHLKAASELRYFDCLASSPTSACSSEGQTSAFVRCGQQVVARACPDPAAQAACTRAARNCQRPGALMQNCSTYLTPMTNAGRNQFVSCMVEGCDDYQFKSCTGYLR